MRDTTPEDLAGHITSPLLTRGQVAKRLKCSVKTIDRLVRKGKLTALRIGAGLVRFRESDLKIFVDTAPLVRPRGGA